MLLIRKISVIVVLMLVVGCQTTTNFEKPEKEKLMAAAKVNVQLGMAYLERKDIQRARQKLILALDQAPNLPEAWYAMGYFLEMMDEGPAANRYYQKSLALGPHRGDVLNNYGTYVCRLGRYQEAIPYFMKAIADKTYLDPSSAYENAALCAMKIPALSQAENYFQHALAENPNRYSALLGLGEVYFMQKKYAFAHEKLQEFLDVSTPTVQSFLLEKRLDQLSPSVGKHDAS